MTAKKDESAYQSDLLGLFQGCTFNACLAAPHCLKLSRKRALAGRLIPSWHDKAEVDRNCTTEVKSNCNTIDLSERSSAIACLTRLRPSKKNLTQARTTERAIVLCLSGIPRCIACNGFERSLETVWGICARIKSAQTFSKYAQYESPLFKSKNKRRLTTGFWKAGEMQTRITPTFTCPHKCHKLLAPACTPQIKAFQGSKQRRRHGERAEMLLVTT